MIKRATWFVGGVAAGAAGAGYAKRRVTATVRRTVDQVGEQLTPSKVASTAVGAARSGTSNVVAAIRDGRRAMLDKEAELIARRDHRIETLDEHLEPGDRLFVDGRPVEVDRVVVVKPTEGKRSWWRRSG